MFESNLKKSSDRRIFGFSDFGLIDTASVEAAYKRLLNGEQPPLMPSERRLESNTPSV